MIREFAAAAVILAMAGAFAADAALPGDPLSRGIALYQDRTKNEAALAELKRAMASQKTRTLARYYSARLNCRYGRFSNARALLISAREDSAGFDDATGMLAWTALQIGNTAEALREWKRFADAVGYTSPNEVISERSIMLPDEYRKRLAEVRAVAASAPVDSAAKAPAESSGAAAKPVPSGVGRPESAPETDSAIGDLDRRMQSQIRNGYYGIGIAAVLLVIGFFLTARWARKRRRIAGPEFLDEVGRMFQESEDRDEFALGDEELAEREFRRVFRERREASEPPRPARPSRAEAIPAEIPVARMAIPEPEPEPEPLPEPEPEYNGYDDGYGEPEEDPDAAFFPKPDPEPDSPGGQRVTEDVKALVVRLHRQGMDVVDIARLADLTRTEVELIIAVRARTVEDLAETAANPETEMPAGAFHRAVAAMSAEGRDDVEIARRLRVSTSEVALARAVIGRKRR